MLFDDAAKEMLRKHLHQAADFSGVEVVTYAVMTNHFHVLVKVPEQGEVSDTELLRRYKVLHPQPTKYATEQIEILADQLKANGPDGKKLREKLLARMGDVSEFMKTLKQRFSIWFNRHHSRFGTLWAERFSSAIVEGNRHFALQMVAAYIDLNPVRAGLAKDPKNYRYCGYGEAEAIGGKMLQGLRMAVENSDSLDDTALLAAYRMRLFYKGAAPKRGGATSGRVSAAALKKVEAAEGRLGEIARLGLRMRWFFRGAIIGGREFVSEHLHEYQERTRKRQHLAVRPCSEKSGGRWRDLFSMRGCSESKG
jgi:REP element-mobilizing transposase RayT